MTHLIDDETEGTDEGPSDTGGGSWQDDRDSERKPFLRRVFKRIFSKKTTSEQDRNGLIIEQWMGALGALTFVFLATSLVTTCTIADQLHGMKEQMQEMKSLSEQAGSSIDASKNANEEIAATAQSALINAQRAIVFVDRLKAAPYFDAQRNVTVWYYAPVMKNGGNTPALNLEYVVLGPHSDVRARPEVEASVVSPEQYYEISARLGAPQDPDDVLNAAETGNATDIIKSAAVGTKSEMPISNASSDIHRASNETTNPYAQIDQAGQFVFGSIHYDDVFGMHHLTKFCFDIGSLSADMDAPALPHRCRHWNCADKEECDKDKQAYDGEFEEARLHPYMAFE